MYPELFRIGDFPITSYGLWLAVGMVLALFVASRLAARDGLPRERIYDLGLWTLVGGLLGSKALMFFVEDSVQIFSLDFLRSGGVYYGGLIGGFLTVAILVPFYKLPFWKVADRSCPRLPSVRHSGVRDVLLRDAAGESRPTSSGECISPKRATITRAFRCMGLTAANFSCTRRS